MAELRSGLRTRRSITRPALRTGPRDPASPQTALQPMPCNRHVTLCPPPLCSLPTKSEPSRPTLSCGILPGAIGAWILGIPWWFHRRRRAKARVRRRPFRRGRTWRKTLGWPTRKSCRWWTRARDGPRGSCCGKERPPARSSARFRYSRPISGCGRAACGYSRTASGHLPTRHSRRPGGAFCPQR